MKKKILLFVVGIVITSFVITGSGTLSANRSKDNSDASALVRYIIQSANAALEEKFTGTLKTLIVTGSAAYQLKPRETISLKLTEKRKSYIAQTPQYIKSIFI